jgi:hypothetical protein
MQTGVIGPRITIPRSPDGVIAELAGVASAKADSATANIRICSR